MYHHFNRQAFCASITPLEEPLKHYQHYLEGYIARHSRSQSYPPVIIPENMIESGVVCETMVEKLRGANNPETKIADRILKHVKKALRVIEEVHRYNPPSAKKDIRPEGFLNHRRFFLA